MHSALAFPPFSTWSTVRIQNGLRRKDKMQYCLCDASFHKAPNHFSYTYRAPESRPVSFSIQALLDVRTFFRKKLSAARQKRQYPSFSGHIPSSQVLLDIATVVTRTFSWPLLTALAKKDIIRHLLRAMLVTPLLLSEGFPDLSYA